MKIGSFILAIVALLVFCERAPAALAPGDTKAAVVVIDGTIDDFERDGFIRRFNQAQRAGATTIIVEINTYGGLVTAGLDISRFIKSRTDVHTIAFVQDKAISAGAMIALACDEIVMRPASVIGDCAPIVFSSDGSIQSLAPTERAKRESPVLADFRDSAARNHHDPLLAEAMVTLDRSIHYVQNATGERRFVLWRDLPAAKEQGWQPAPNIPDPINSATELLTLHSSLATKIGLSAAESASVETLAQQRGLNIVSRYAPGVGELAIQLLNTWGARMALLVIFLLTLKLAFTIPGHGAPEAIALLSLGLLLGVPLLTGYAEWWEVLMIFVGLALLAFEIFIFPGHFVSAILGVAMIIFGLVLTFAGQEPTHPGMLPGTAGTWAGMQRGLAVVTAGLLCSLGLWVWLNRYLSRIPYLKHLMLAPAGGDPMQMGALAADIVWPLVGQSGRALTDLKPGGIGEFHDQVLDDQRSVSVVSDGAFIRAGADIVVTESRGNRVVVQAAR